MIINSCKLIRCVRYAPHVVHKLICACYSWVENNAFKQLESYDNQHVKRPHCNGSQSNIFNTYIFLCISFYCYLKNFLKLLNKK